MGWIGCRIISRWIANTSVSCIAYASVLVSVSFSISNAGAQESGSANQGKSTSDAVSSDEFEKYLTSKSIPTKPYVSKPTNPVAEAKTSPGDTQVSFPPKTERIVSKAGEDRPAGETSTNALIERLPLPVPQSGKDTGNYYDTKFTTNQPGVAEYVPDDEDIVLPQIGAGGIGWWESKGPSGAMRPLLTRKVDRIVPVDLEQLIWESLQYSKKIQSILKVPQIQRTEIDVAKGEFDPKGYAKSNLKDTSDPVGNTLTTGGPNRLNEYFWENSVGITDRNSFGGKTDFSQAVNARDSNSLFFKPNNQVDSKLTLNYTQPLMRGAGVFYNTSMIRINEIKELGAIALANRELQDHAIAIHSTYWELVLDRFHMVQSINARHRLIQLRTELENRKGKDLIETHLSRANAAIGQQDSQLEILKARIKGHQLILASLVGSPSIQRDVCDELIPLTLPVAALPAEEWLEDEFYSAPLYRGDILAIQHEIEVESVKRELAVNELKPTFDLVLEGYLRGLEGDKRLVSSLTRQIDSGSPSYAGGFVFQAPYRQRAARANLKGRCLALEQLYRSYEYELEKARAQILRAVASTKGTYRSIHAALKASNSAKEEIELYIARLDDFFGENSSPGNIMNEMLDAEARLLSTEKELATRQVEHMQSLIQVKYESGTLLAVGGSSDSAPAP